MTRKRSKTGLALAFAALALAGACASQPRPSPAPGAAIASVSGTPAAASSSAAPVAAPLPGLLALPSWRDGQASDWSLLNPVFEGKSIVLLGESLHVTSEFPRVRLPILRHLHEQLGFDVVAFEGSMLDAWLAQDDLLRAPDEPDAVKKAAAIGWLTLWNTPDMLAVLEYIHATRSGAGLYFASMDIQPAMGPVKQRVFRNFIERVLTYAGTRKAGAVADELAGILEPMRTCSGQQPPPPDRVRAVERVKQAIRQSDTSVRKRSAIHADALSLIPDMLDQRLRHCTDAVGANGSFDWKLYKEARDRYQAANVMALRERVSRTHRVVVWGHHTHVAYQAAGARARVSIGGVLRETAPGQTYSLGLFAGAGKFVKVQDGPKDNLTLVDVARPGAPCCSGVDALRALDASEHGYLLDFRLAGTDPRVAFARERRGYPLEGEGVQVSLAEEFDGVVFLPRVSEGHIEGPSSR